MILISPPGVRRMLDGLTSRWIKPRFAAYLSPPATLLTTEIASARLSGPCLLDVVVKIAAGDVFQHQVVPARVDPSIVDRHDVGVLERLGARASRKNR